VITFAKEKWNEKKIDFRHYSVLELDSLNKKFDVILCFEVIEHLILNDGKILLKQAFNSLSKPGILILSSSFPDLEVTAKKVAEKNIFHLKIYTKKELEKFAKESGFQSVMFIGDTMAVIKK
jgi:2-polyprenyl-3-methyl-5-hydroxy-6-metoxy-1,4-benzoquinol methylase